VPTVPGGRGEFVVIVRPGPEIVKVRAFEVAGPGFSTVMLAVPCVAISAAEIAAVNWELLTNVVARFAPFHLTVEFEAKLEPLTVNVKSAPPTIAEVGLRLFRTGAEAVTAKVRVFVAVCGVG
jgi:hypothetical protein